MSEAYAAGTIVDRRYRILGPLGKGGMGGVYTAEHLGFGRKVALKVLLAGAAADATDKERFVLEARAVCHLQHPNVVTYHDFGTDPDTGRLYLVMELLDGLSLAQVQKREAPLPTSRVMHLIAQLCDALADAHDSGVIHRDLKPGNVMLVKRGEDRDFVKLIDFGIVRVLGRRRDGSRPLTDAGMIIGTTAYLAPEYIQDQTVDERTDIYALGIMCYELIAGHRPFDHKEPMRIMAMHLRQPPTPLTSLQDGRVVPELLSNTILRALAKNPNERFRKVLDLKAHLLAAARPLLEEDVSSTTLKQAPGPLTAPVSTAIEFAPFVPPTDAWKPIPLITSPQTGPTPRSPWRIVALVALLMVAGTTTALVWPRAEPPAHAPVAEKAAPRSVIEAEEEEPEPPEEPEPAAAVAPEPEQVKPQPPPPPPRRQPELDEARIPMLREGPEPTSAEPARAPRPAPITVQALPYGEIYAGKRHLGSNFVTIVLPEGRACFRAVHETLGAKDGCVLAAPGRRNRVVIKFK